MFGLNMLEVLIGLFTVYFLFSTTCTAIVEAIAAWSGVRSKNLDDAIKELLSGKLTANNNWVDMFYDHPLIRSLSKNDNGRPSYIPSETFRQVIESLLLDVNAGTSVIDAAKQMPNDPTNNIAGIIKTLANEADNNVQKFRSTLEAHFDAVMDRASGWYKRRAQNVTYVIAAVLVLSFNVDTLMLVKQLSHSPEVLEQLLKVTDQQIRCPDEKSVDCASSRESASDAGAATQSAIQIHRKAIAELQTTGLSFGWTSLDELTSHLPSKLAGLFISIIAVSLGAPFWFDILQRFMQIRATGQKPGAPKKK